MVSAPSSPADLDNDAWLKGLTARCLNDAFKRPKDKNPVTARIDAANQKMFRDLFIKEWPELDTKPRTSVTSGLLNTLGTLNSGFAAEILSTESTVTPDDLMNKGKWIYVDFPETIYGPSGRLISAAFKYSLQTALLRRDPKPNDAPTFIVGDKAQRHIYSFDAKFLAEARSHRAGTCYLVQSLHSLHNAMESHSHHQTLGMLTNFGHIIAHTVGDSETAKTLSDLLGQTRETFVSASGGNNTDMWDTIMGNEKMNFSVSSQWCPVLQPAAFQGGLRNGGAANSFLVDAWMIRAGEPFKDGNRHMKVTFSQK